MNMNFNNLFDRIQDQHPDELLYQNDDRRFEDEDTNEDYGNRDLEGHYPSEYRGENSSPTVDGSYPDEYRRFGGDEDSDRFGQAGRYYDRHDHSRFGHSSSHDNN